jgi:hypothetical protein
MQLAIAVICTGLVATLFGGTAADVTASELMMMVIYVAGCKFIDWYIPPDRGPTDRNKPY